MTEIKIAGDKGVLLNLSNITMVEKLYSVKYNLIDTAFLLCIHFAGGTPKQFEFDGQEQMDEAWLVLNGVRI